ncbi:MAG: 50S ribosomal protein L15 [Phaeodactylibacter sp.]|nr:50S ribosomal protein L15 [Phaeodactylibacter sp.]MCB9266826.1 50S ribosomal protein L15 [Lewinellaceae bacterium]MCB9287890.1 50S ribosomal protein L15 [Lewinellaceae bacterium]
MKLNSLKPAKGSVKKRKRIARGVGSGHGRTSTRGHKGAKSRSGFKEKRNFEGGQMPLQMRLPKIGFKNPNRVAYTPINLDRLQMISEKYNLDTVDLEALIKNGIVRKNDKVKILGGGELKAKLTVQAHAFSASAKQAIEALGGTATAVE